MSYQCPHMMRVTGFSGIRMCQRPQGHEGPHSVLVDSDEQCVVDEIRDFAKALTTVEMYAPVARDLLRLIEHAPHSQAQI